jgi:hypothetical protein
MLEVCPKLKPCQIKRLRKIHNSMTNEMLWDLACKKEGISFPESLGIEFLVGGYDVDLSYKIYEGDRNKGKIIGLLKKPDGIQVECTQNYIFLKDTLYYRKNPKRKDEGISILRLIDNRYLQGEDSPENHLLYTH